MDFKKMRALDEDGDISFGRGLQDYGDNLLSTKQNISTRLKSFKYDCFFDLNAGIDWFNLLGRRGKYFRDLIEINVRLCILQSLYVKEIVDLQININDERNLRLTYKIDTVFGIINDTLEGVL